MRIAEIFYSIQGESTRAGQPCVFVRLTGCSLRCVYCDTKYSYSGGREMALDEVLSVVAGYPANLVEVTGGEPLEQEQVYPLMGTMLDRGYTVMLETGGHVSIARVPKEVIKIIDIKCPDSREAHTVCWENIGLADPHVSGQATDRPSREVPGAGDPLTTTAIALPLTFSDRLRVGEELVDAPGSHDVRTLAAPRGPDGPAD